MKLCYWQGRCLSGREKKKAAGNFGGSSPWFQGICNYTRLLEILGFHESVEVRCWTDSHALRLGLFHIAAFTVIREGSLFSSRTCVKWQLDQSVPLGLWQMTASVLYASLFSKNLVLLKRQRYYKVWPLVLWEAGFKGCSARRWNVARLLPESRSPLVWLTALTLCFPEVLKEIQSTLEGGRGWVSTNFCS